MRRQRGPWAPVPGNIVRVKPLAAILATLDGHGERDGLPFMPEMVTYCGRSFAVGQRVDKTCLLGHPMRRLSDVVALRDLRCNGGAHGGCQLGCMLFWKTAWLEPVPADGAEVPAPGEPQIPDMLFRNGRGVYSCQATSLPSATGGDLPVWAPGQYLRDLRSRTYTTWEFVRMVLHLLRERVTWETHVRRHHAQNGAAPPDSLHLHAGELVRVRSKQEIARTLDAGGRNRGLSFATDMLGCCGRVFRVQERVERIIHEPSGRMRTLRNTVILEGAVCDRHRGCGRRMSFLWREIWLERV